MLIILLLLHVWWMPALRKHELIKYLWTLKLEFFVRLIIHIHTQNPYGRTLLFTGIEQNHCNPCLLYLLQWQVKQTRANVKGQLKGINCTNSYRHIFPLTLFSIYKNVIDTFTCAFSTLMTYTVLVICKIQIHKNHTIDLDPYLTLTLKTIWRKQTSIGNRVLSLFSTFFCSIFTFRLA